MQITDPEDFSGALRSESSFDGVKFKRIIMVLGNENWNQSQAGSSLKCFRMPPEWRRLWFHCSAGTVCVLNSYRSYHYPPKSTSLCQPLPVLLKLFQWSLKAAHFISPAPSTIMVTVAPRPAPEIALWESALIAEISVSVLENTACL